jgi:predicted GNAT superfamily acetyltransferase
MGVEPGTPAEPAPAAQPEQPAAAEPAAEPAPQAAAGGDQAQAAQAAQQPTSTGTVFDNPEQLAKDFEEYMSAGGKITPQFRGAIKAALQTGFKVVESKQRKLLKVLKEARRIDQEIKKLKKQQP